MKSNQEIFMKNNELTKLVSYQLNGKKGKSAIDTLSIRLDETHTEILRKLSEQTGKTRGAVAKILLDAALFQIGHEHGFLPAWLEYEYQKIIAESEASKNLMEQCETAVSSGFMKEVK